MPGMVCPRLQEKEGLSWHDSVGKKDKEIILAPFYGKKLPGMED